MSNTAIWIYNNKIVDSGEYQDLDDELADSFFKEIDEYDIRRDKFLKRYTDEKVKEEKSSRYDHLSRLLEPKLYVEVRRFLPRSKIKWNFVVVENGVITEKISGKTMKEIKDVFQEAKDDPNKRLYSEYLFTPVLSPVGTGYMTIAALFILIFVCVFWSIGSHLKI